MHNENKFKNKSLFFKVYYIRPETKWVILKQAEDILINIGGLNSYMLQNIGMIYE